ncbi:MAG: RnfABCDGE type electron transport complex subunit B [Nitrosomonas sp.]|nr:MAG: RnfABCDGE type electron transport complex subunit B [Nitrosomonas sp.]
MSLSLIDRIDVVLPQTQCGKCGFSGCRPYAQAIAEGRADINQCPPGGQAGVEKIAQLLGVPVKRLDIAHGVPNPGKSVAWIDERLCIGCTFCLRVCPVDAIVGAAKQLHTVIATECTGCELCIAPCPMDCIRLISVGGEVDEAAKRQTADRARRRYQFRQQRLANNQQSDEKTASVVDNSQPEGTLQSADKRKQAIIAAALKRAADLRASRSNGSSSGNTP